MLLTIDIGNSRIKCAVFEGSDIVCSFDMASDRRASGASYRHALRAHAGDIVPQRAAIASVVPELERSVGEAVKREFMVLPEFVRSSDMPEGLLAYKAPASLGADRLAAAVAGHFLYGRGERPVVVVDAGTAVTFEVVSASGRHLGGAIWAGPTLVAESLGRGTSLLPQIDPKLPRQVVGTSTEAGLRSGILYGFLDGVAGILQRLQRKAGADAFTVATGGYGAWLADRLESIDAYEPALVLHGIRLIVTGSLPQG